MSKTPENLTQIVARRVRKLRERKGLSQEDFAELCGLHRTYIGAIERGERNITLRTLEVLAAALKVTPSNLIRRAKP